jgi:hypothetical protein
MQKGMHAKGPQRDHSTPLPHTIPTLFFSLSFKSKYALFILISVTGNSKSQLKGFLQVAIFFLSVVESFWTFGS